MAFETEFVTMLGDTTCTGLVDPDCYFSEQGRVRETFLYTHVPNARLDMARGVVPITCDAQVRSHQAVGLFESIACRLTFAPPRPASIKLWFEFLRDKQTLVASGYQTIAFAGTDHRLVRIPDHWRRAAEAFAAVAGPEQARAIPDLVLPLLPTDGPAFDWSYRAVLGDTNAVGNVYFARTAKLVSAARDSFVLAHIGPDYAWTAAPLLTIEQAAISYSKDFFAGDPIRCSLRFALAEQDRIEMHAELRHGETGLGHARSLQIIAFSDATGNRTSVPAAWLHAVSRFPALSDAHTDDA